MLNASLSWLASDLQGNEKHTSFPYVTLFEPMAGSTLEHLRSHLISAANWGTHSRAYNAGHNMKAVIV